MFVLTMTADTIRVPPSLLAAPTLTSVTSEIETRYPNRIIVDVGLVICLHGDVLRIGDGILAPGDAGAHHECVFRLVVFRPFVEEVLLGTVLESNEIGLRVSVGGFFDDVFIPAYFMLNPSTFDESTGLWVWTPVYDDDDEGDEGEDGDADADADAKADEEGGGENENRFEIEIGSELRFKVKAVNFTRITTTMKGVQATTTSTAHMSKLDMDRALNGGSKTTSTDGAGEGEGAENGESGGGVRRRSSSADLSDSTHRPAPMQIVGSICEDGLGLLSWWTAEGDENDEEEKEEEVEAGEEEAEENEEEFGDPGGE